MFPTPEEMVALWIEFLEFCTAASEREKSEPGYIAWDDPAHRKELSNKLAHWDRTYKFAGKDKSRDRQGEFHHLMWLDNRRWAAERGLLPELTTGKPPLV